ncbi:MAG: hypothetical protein Q9217_002273 [Psora testacea]
MPGTNTTATFTQLPANILEAFIPGYGIISRFLLDVLGFDITLVVSVCALVFGFATAGKFIWKHVYQQVQTYFMSYIRIERHDDIYDYIMEWVASQKVSRDSRNLIAKTNYENPWEFLDEHNQDLGEQLNASNGLLNFSNWDAKTPPKFEPSYGTHRFFHKGRFFQFRRDQKHVMDSGWGGYTTMQNDEHVTLTCLGRSNEPVKMLIREARDFYLNKQKTCTTVRRPLPKEQRSRGHGGWTRAATRPSRPMDTVVLDHELKHRVLNDINEYLHPATPRWYSNRGIPYRRGYLLHGPPGTGKSSLAWAIAGVFGLDIYCISLVDPNLTEEELGMLFTTLPRRCVVLLEDIDSAGLSKRQESKGNDKQQAETEAAKIGAEITKAFESVQKRNDKKDKQGISLSGLLNAIDGVASHEGRVLILTTNFPEKLDEALIRPGRIDMKVEFTNATRTQTRELFTRMYSPDTPTKAAPAPATNDGPVTSQKLPSNKLSSINEKRMSLKSPDPNTLTPPESPTQATTPATSPTPPPYAEAESQLEEIATEFADIIPEDAFTPAEIQGFLLTRKKEPNKALAEVAAWRDALLTAKREKKSQGEVNP